MTHDPSLNGVAGPERGNLASRPTRATSSTGGAAFRALLDQLEEKTQRLREDGAKVTEPAGLAGAVDRARDSIDDALSLGDQLLEAYHAARQRAALETFSDEAASGDQPPKDMDPSQ